MSGLAKFEPFGSWELSGGQRIFEPTAPDVQQGVYGLTVNGEIMYIGKFQGGLKSRIGVFKNPPPSQETHYRLAPLITHELIRSRSVAVVVLDLPRLTPQELKERTRTLRQLANPAWNLK